RHNLTYWKNGEYLGVGAGACSHISRRRYYNARRPLEFCEAVEKGRSPVTEIIPPAGAPHDVVLATEMSETAMMGLRLSDGLSLQDFRDRFGRDLAEVFPGVVENLSGLGLVSESAGSIRLTRRGLFVANAVFREFVLQAVS
ncbi:MAG: coproporphyrinogen III oxidase, partial [Bacillota bacterium]